MIVVGRRPGPYLSANAAVGRLPSKMSVTSSEAMTVLRLRDLVSLYLSEEQRAALRFMWGNFWMSYSGWEELDLGRLVSLMSSLSTASASSAKATVASSASWDR